jgi:carbamoyltransferase
MSEIFGISFNHDSSFCAFENGKVKYFSKEERFSKKKRDTHPVLSMLAYNTNDTDVALAFSSPTYRKGVAESYIDLVRKKHNVKNFVEYSDQHHLIHANLAFYNSGFSEALVFVIDRNGSVYFDSCRESETVFVASYPNNFKPIYKNFWIEKNSAHEELLRFQRENPDCDVNGRSMFSIVKVYESATSLIKQHPLENGKTMGLSAYGDKDIVYPNLFIDKITPNDYYFAHDQIKDMKASVNRELNHLAIDSVPKNEYQIYANYAWQVQKQTQEAVAELINRYVEKTGIKNVCVTGGYGLNVVANYYYITQFPDVNFFFEPLADDSGNSIGAAMKLYRDQTLDSNIYPLEHTFFSGIRYDLRGIQGSKTTVQEVADLLSNGKSVAIYNGLSEAGPRALGNRSILFDPRDPDAKEKINKIKKREWYRPFAAMSLEKDAQIYFDMGKIEKSEFMTISFPVNEKAKKHIPGVVHIDGTCRIQTVNKNNREIFNLLNEFKNLTGVGILLNTSFNLAGKPLVETPEDAFYTFKNSNLDYVWFPEISKIVSRKDIGE